MNTSIQSTIILLIEQIVVALGGEFKLYLPQLIPHMLRVFMHDNSSGRIVSIKVSSQEQHRKRFPAYFRVPGWSEPDNRSEFLDSQLEGRPCSESQVDAQPTRQEPKTTNTWCSKFIVYRMFTTLSWLSLCFISFFYALFLVNVLSYTNFLYYPGTDSLSIEVSSEKAA